MHYRAASPADFPAILAIQNGNLHASLTEDERRDGFLSAAFTPEHFAQMAREVAVMVAADAGQICGYLSAGSLEFHRQFPLLATMIEQFPRVNLLGRPLASRKTFIYGPVCVARSHRGRGLLRGLYDALRRELAGGYDAGVGFVAKDNERSLAAHAGGLGMTIAGDFAFAGKQYWILAFHVPPPPSC
jgi:L-amino acid N-acyltransferase YncA